MTKPKPKPIEPAQVAKLAHQLVARVPFPFLATVDGDHPRIRPISPLKTEGFVIYVANLRFYHKTGEIAANPKVELCYMDEDHDQVRLSGVVEIVTEKEVIQEIWDESPLLKQFLGEIDNPNWMLYRIKPTQVRYMQEWALEYYDVPFGPIP